LVVQEFTMTHGMIQRVIRRLRRAGGMARLGGLVRLAASIVAVAGISMVARPVVAAQSAGTHATQSKTKTRAAADSTRHAAPAAATTKKPAGVRTLEAINIEGEIAVPQVLFITARDTRRFRDGLGATYRMSAVDVARALTLPGRVRVVPQQSHKEEGK
jgi:hypothetical protein